VLDAAHAALVSSGVPPTDKFHRVFELEADNVCFHPGYPDLTSQRTDDFVLIEILWSVGRSVKVKKKFLQELMERLSRADFNPENVMVCFKEIPWEDGRSAADGSYTRSRDTTVSSQCGSLRTPRLRQS
jgi:hypothetical protein